MSYFLGADSSLLTGQSQQASNLCKPRSNSYATIDKKMILFEATANKELAKILIETKGFQ